MLKSIMIGSDATSSRDGLEQGIENFLVHFCSSGVGVAACVICAAVCSLQCPASDCTIADCSSIYCSWAQLLASTSKTALYGGKVLCGLNENFDIFVTEETEFYCVALLDISNKTSFAPILQCLVCICYPHCLYRLLQLEKLNQKNNKEKVGFLWDSESNLMWVFVRKTNSSDLNS